MAFQAGTGLVTNRNEALLLLACTAEVEVCEDCFTLTGGDARIKYLAPLEGHNATYHVVLGWDCEYRGGITLAPARWETLQRDVCVMCRRVPRAQPCVGAWHTVLIPQQLHAAPAGAARVR